MYPFFSTFSNFIFILLCTPESAEGLPTRPPHFLALRLTAPCPPVREPQPGLIGGGWLWHKAGRNGGFCLVFYGLNPPFTGYPANYLWEDGSHDCEGLPYAVGYLLIG
jgi:hypothetical protein